MKQVTRSVKDNESNKGKMVSLPSNEENGEHHMPSKNNPKKKLT